MYLYICYQSLGMQFSYPKNKGVMNKIKEGLLKESLFNILSQKKEIICFVLLIKTSILYILNTISYKVTLNSWRIEIIILLLHLKSGSNMKEMICGTRCIGIEVVME